MSHTLALPSLVPAPPTTRRHLGAATGPSDCPPSATSPPPVSTPQNPTTPARGLLLRRTRAANCRLLPGGQTGKARARRCSADDSERAVGLQASVAALPQWVPRRAQAQHSAPVFFRPRLIATSPRERRPFPGQAPRVCRRPAPCSLPTFASPMILCPIIIASARWPPLCLHFAPHFGPPGCLSAPPPDVISRLIVHPSPARVRAHLLDHLFSRTLLLPRTRRIPYLPLPLGRSPVWHPGCSPCTIRHSDTVPAPPPPCAPLRFSEHVPLSSPVPSRLAPPCINASWPRPRGRPCDPDPTPPLSLSLPLSLCETSKWRCHAPPLFPGAHSPVPFFPVVITEKKPGTIALAERECSASAASIMACGVPAWQASPVSATCACPCASQAANTSCALVGEPGTQAGPGILRVNRAACLGTECHDCICLVSPCSLAQGLARNPSSATCQMTSVTLQSCVLVQFCSTARRFCLDESYATGTAVRFFYIVCTCTDAYAGSFYCWLLERSGCVHEGTMPGSPPPLSGWRALRRRPAAPRAGAWPGLAASAVSARASLGRAAARAAA